VHIHGLRVGATTKLSERTSYSIPTQLGPGGEFEAENRVSSLLKAVLGKTWNPSALVEDMLRNYGHKPPLVSLKGYSVNKSVDVGCCRRIEEEDNEGLSLPSFARLTRLDPWISAS
jgi:hypothetical protein